MAKADLTAQRLRELLHYDPETGLFTNRIQRGPVKAGALAGRLQADGYRSIHIGASLYKSHRLAWLHVFGVWPDGNIDHINGVRDDNRISNLRVARGSQNHYNMPMSPVNTSGYKGVSWRVDVKKWRAQCRVNGKNYAIGNFATALDASAAYNEFAMRHHGEFFKI